MIFKNFGLENYKGISDAVFIDVSSDDTKPYCIIGNNESGKTTILKGIETVGRLLRGCVLQNGELTAIRPKDTYFTGDIILSTTIVLEDAEIRQIRGSGKKHLIEELNKNNHTVQIIFQYSFNQSKPTKQQTIILINDIKQNHSANLLEVIKCTAPDIIYYDDFKFNVPDKIRFARSSSAEDLTDDPTLKSKKNIFWQNVLNDLLTGSSPNIEEDANAFQRDIVDWSDDNDGDDDAVDQRIASINYHLNAVIAKDWEDITGEKVIFDRVTIKNASQQNTGFIDYSLRVEAQNKTFLLHERSKGFKWFFCFKILTDIRKHRNKNGTVFLLDEPASNLHIYPQEKILTSLEKLSGEDKTSIIYATHTPFLIKPDHANNIFVVNNISDNEFSPPSIACCKLSEYKAPDEKSIRAIEPILTRAALEAIQGDNTSWKDRIASIQAFIRAQAPADTVIQNTEKMNTIFKFVEHIKQYILN